MKTICAFRSLMIFEALLYLAEPSKVYFLEGSTVLLKCSSHFRSKEWAGPAHTDIFPNVPVFKLIRHHRVWPVTVYTRRQIIISTLLHSNRLQVIERIRTDDFDLQIINASVLDEGFYFCGMGYTDNDDVWYILKMINASRIRYIYYPEGSTVSLKCLLDMEWFGPEHFKSFYQPSVIAMHENRSMWTVNRYTGGKSIFRTLPHHNRLKVIRRIQTGDYELQIRNASVLDEGLYFCEDSEMPAVPDYYILQLINETMISSMHARIEEINEGETKTLCCYVDSNSTIWVKKRNKDILVNHNVNESCYTIQLVYRDDQGNYTCIAGNMFGNGSVTIVLRVRWKK